MFSSTSGSVVKQPVSILHISSCLGLMLSGRIVMLALLSIYPFWILYQLQQLFCISVMAEEYGFRKSFYFSLHLAVRDHCLLSNNGFSKSEMWQTISNKSDLEEFSSKIQWPITNVLYIMQAQCKYGGEHMQLLKIIILFLWGKMLLGIFVLNNWLRFLMSF